ncbi:SAM-dependent methyltransferase [Aquabacter cavernae]|uniref:SAM-dependent methyltransferase n=1 Tax=Aquabacter cavernae TaxID=2496029 RepID=UPI000F8D04F4|nr:cyclopropane-fatty-acyl-phospholipid synthase family protein [Aquabacter cavernae]
MSIERSSPHPASLLHRTGLPRIAATALRRLLSPLPCGQVQVIFPDGTRLDHKGPLPGPTAHVQVHRWRAVRRLVTGGDIGFAEAFAAGDWSTPDLPAVLEFGAVNALHLERLVAGSAPARLWNRLRHGLRMNSKAGSRRNITFHYDLGNAFYRLWLDASMSYSSALYARPDMSLEEAQQAKITRVGELLNLRGGESVLEIGAGWGALATHLAGRGAHVTGLTLSHEQLAHAAALPAPQRGSMAFRLEDYRDTGGSFDRIVSIEMLEAVGERYWPRYFQALRERLNPGGLAVLQVITIAEERFESYRRSADFIQRYIFPGGMLLTPTIIAREAEKAGLVPAASETFGQSYARTLADWRRRFLDQTEALEQMGFDRTFRRIWDYYLAYCEAGFRCGAINVGLYTLKG